MTAARHAPAETGRPTEAEIADQAVRRHLAALMVVAQQGSNADVVRLIRAETCRLVSAICTALRHHRLDSDGRCPVCASTTCRMLADIRRALLPVRL